MKKIITSIDIGSDTIKFIVGEIFNDNVNILHASSIHTKGIRKGIIFDSNLFVNSIKDGLKVVNEDLGFNVKKVIVNVPGYEAKFMYVTSSLELNDEVIDTNTVNRIIKESVYNKIQSDYELVTVLPLSFKLNSSEDVEFPVSLKAKKLDFSGIMITVPKKNIYSVVSALERSGLEVLDITLSGISDYFEVRNDKLDKQVGAIINIGHETTDVSIINKGKLMNTEVLQIGSHHVEKDLSSIFGINIIDAREIKEKFAAAHKRFVTLTDTYEIQNGAGEILKLTKEEVTDVCASRIKQILNYSLKQIYLLTKKNIEYIVVTGGITEMKYFKNLVYEILGKDVIIYVMKDIGVRDNKYTSALGSIKYFINKLKIRGKDCPTINSSDEELLLTPESKTKRGKVDISKIFKGITKGREDNNE